MNKKDKVIVNQIYDIDPVKVTFIGPSCSTFFNSMDPLIDGWQVNVNFKGNITSLFDNEDLLKEYGLLPDHCETLFKAYSSLLDVTHVKYLFDVGLFKRGQKRAYTFRDRIQSQMIAPVIRTGGEANTKNKVSPIFVSKMPKRIFDDKNEGYLITVRYKGDWTEYPPVVLKQADYLPGGSEIIDFYNDDVERVTRVDYFFKIDSLNTGIKRAWDFLDKINNKISADNKIKRDFSQFYVPVAVLPHDIYYKGDVFEKVTLPVRFGDIYAQLKIAEGCVTENVRKDAGTKRLPVPEYGSFDANKNASNDYYMVRYNFYGRSFKDAFFDMNRFKANLMSMMRQQRNNESVK